MNSQKQRKETPSYYEKKILASSYVLKLAAPTFRSHF